MAEQKKGIKQIAGIFSENIDKSKLVRCEDGTLHSPGLKPGPYNVSDERLAQLRKIKLP